MQICRHCGSPVEFRFIDGRCIPMHTEGGCTGISGRPDDSQVRRSVSSECRKTTCPVCRGAVYFIRHNGGSVWIEPPLGPPWDRHPCFDSSGSASKAIEVVSSELAEQLGLSEGLVTGVVRSAEISKDRRQTILDIVIGEQETLSVLLKGGADSLLGQLVIADPRQRLLYSGLNAKICFTIASALAGPESLIGRGKLFHLPLGNNDLEKLRAEIKHGELSKAQHRSLRKFRDHGLNTNWKLPDLLALIPLITGKDQDRAIQMAAVMIVEKAEAHGDCSAASTLARLVAPAKRPRLIAWFRNCSPINIDLTRKQRKAYMFKTTTGVQRPFRINLARATPI